MSNKNTINKALLVKLTSMGDLIHALPALTDLQQARPELRVDWVIDEAFAEVATWHPIVDQVITSAHRRWKKHFMKVLFGGELKQFISRLRARRYDLIVDGQTNHKSAVVTWLCKGTKAGLDKHSAREFAAPWAYHKKYAVPKDEHAVQRLRQLFALAFDYALPVTPADFGLDRSRFKKPALNLPENYLVFIHNASWQTKLWPEQYWQQLIALAISAGQSVLLPCGNAEEQARAQRLAEDHEQVHALPKLGLSEVAYLIAKAQGAVCVDTGLSHLTGALEVPAVTLYGATDSGLIGAPGQRQVHLQADFACAPCYHKQCQYRGPSQVQPACFEALTPALVWQRLMGLINPR